MFSSPRSLKRLLFVVIAGALLWPVGVLPVFARNAANIVPATWYVSNTGDDLNSCSAIDAPCATINGAIAKATAGDTIDVAIGIYTGTGDQVVLIDRSLTLSGGWDATFTTQSGLSTIDGQATRRGITVNAGVTTALDHYLIQNGFSDTAGAGIQNNGMLTVSHSTVSSNQSSWNGGGVWNYGVLSVDSSIIKDNKSLMHGGGIYNWGQLTVNFTKIDGNVSIQGGGGVMVDQGTATVNNTTISANTGQYGSGLVVCGAVVLSNSTISGNAGYALYMMAGNLTLDNVTVSSNSVGGILNQGNSIIAINNSTISYNGAKDGSGIFNAPGYSGQVLLKNSILADNTLTDGSAANCTGQISSAGYNLIADNAGCTFAASTGDQVGTPSAPIRAGLLPLADNGGPTYSHALQSGSPAINAGNPATPGGDDPNACLPTDQRGLPRPRPTGTVCDVGAYELQWPVIQSISRVNASPTSAASADFAVAFSAAVTGVDATDFALTTTGVAAPSITGITGSGAAYTVTVKTGSGNGTIRLDLVDDDSILDGSSTPLGGVGAGNGNFTGQVYTVSKIPVARSPSVMIWDITPGYSWGQVPRATQYRYQLLKGTTVLYTRTVLASTCTATACSNTPTTLLLLGAYKWHVQALVDGVWSAYSPYKAFTVYAPKVGYWKRGYSDYAVDFYITPSRVSVTRFGLSFYVSGCHKSYKLVKSVPAVINNQGTFLYTGPFYVKGTFAKTALNAASASGTATLSSYYIAGCGSVSGSAPWTAFWINASQPKDAAQGLGLFVVPPILDAPLSFASNGYFTLDP